MSPDATGWFSAILGASVSNPVDPADFRQPMWLGIQVASDAAEMVPRVALTPAPYALSVDYANVLGLPGSFPSSWTDVSNKPTSFPAMWADITGKPSIFSSDWTSVSGKPSAFPVDPSVVQSRVSGSCAANQYVRIVNQNGTVVCGSDANSGGTVTDVSVAGTGNPISVTSGTTTPTLAFKTCGGGQVLKYDPTNGWTCASVSPIVVNAVGCGQTCVAIAAEDYTTTVTVNSVTITTPGPGTIVVQFTGTAECWVTGSKRIHLLGQLLATSREVAQYSDGSAAFRMTGVTGYFDGNMNAHRAFTVASAGTYTYYYRANNSNAAVAPVAACKFYGGNMTATFYP